VVSGGEGFGSSRFVSSLGPKFTKFDDWEPLTRQDAVAARKGESEGLAAATSFKANAEDLKVDVFGNVAIATFVMNYTIEAAGTVTAARARSTVAFARDQTGWKIIHEHHSAFKSNP
jgi:ketosteroid isomerase-like protein